MSQVHVTRRYRFCAAHRLHTDQLSPEENWAAFGKCNNPNSHGHNYVVLVTIESGGEGQNIQDLDRLVNASVVDRFDHRDLNCDPAFAELTTTGENIVKLIWEILEPQLPAGRLQKVGVIETRDNYFEYAGIQ
jgi:6-pyruvoyltetrahydropterin/6-carboxytetrahydropterin synthase